jgi:hypothetical protein
VVGVDHIRQKPQPRRRHAERNRIANGGLRVRGDDAGRPEAESAEEGAEFRHFPLSIVANGADLADAEGARRADGVEIRIEVLTLDDMRSIGAGRADDRLEPGQPKAPPPTQSMGTPSDRSGPSQNSSAMSVSTRGRAPLAASARTM